MMSHFPDKDAMPLVFHNNMIPNDDAMTLVPNDDMISIVPHDNVVFLFPDDDVMSLSPHEDAMPLVPNMDVMYLIPTDDVDTFGSVFMNPKYTNMPPDMIKNMMTPI